MATIEERLTALERELTALEQENAALRKSDELQTIALRALATKDEFTKLRDTNNNIFDALINHDQLTNERLGDLQTQETRQGLKEQDKQIAGLYSEVATQGQKLDQMLVMLTTLVPKPE